MTHDEIESAIERLRKISYGARKYNALEVVEAVVPDGSWVDGLTDLLKQADHDTHMELPIDADGVPIHVGDELCGHYYPDGGVYCMSINGSEAIFVNKAGKHYKDAMLWKPSECRHYHKPTVEDVLRVFARTVAPEIVWDDEMHDELFGEYAAKLREAMVDE